MESKRVFLVAHMVQELENTNIKHQHFGIIIISLQVNEGMFSDFAKRIHGTPLKIVSHYTRIPINQPV